MRTVTSAYREKVNSGEAIHLIANLYDAQGTLTELDEDAFMEGATFSGGACPSGEFTVGGCVISSFRFVLNNWDGAFDDYDFSGAYIEPYLGHESDHIRMGRYYFASHKTFGHTIQCVAYDALKLMDETQLSLTYPITAANAVAAIASNHSMTVSGTIPSINLTDPGEAMTERMALSYISAMCGKFVSITPDNKITFKWFDGTALEKETIFSEEMEVTETEITGIKSGTAMTGTDGYVLDLSDNPFITAANITTVLQNAGSVVGTAFRAGSVSILADPSIEAGDLIEFESQTGETVTLLITQYVYKMGISEDVLCDAETVEETDLRVSAYTVARNAQGAADEANANALEASQKVDDLEIGGRNLLWNTRHYDKNWYKSSGLTVTEDPEEDVSVVNWGTVGTASWRHIRNFGTNIVTIPYSLVRNKEVTFSFWIKLDVATALTMDIVQVPFSVINQGTTSRAKYSRNILTFDTVATTEWRKLSATVKVTDSIFVNGSGTMAPETDLFGVEIYNHSTLATHVKKIKLEFGNKATDWTPAPEDIDADISAVETIANNAMTAANGKNTIYHQSTQPTGTFTEGDTWFDTANDYAMYTWNGTAWVLEQFGEDSIAANAIKAGHINAGAITADKIAANAITAAMISGKDITGGTIRTNLGNSRNFVIYDGDVQEESVSTPEQVYTKVRPQGLANLVISNGSEVFRSQLIPAIFTPDALYPEPSEFAGAEKYGWYATHFMYSPRIYTKGGKVATKYDVQLYEGRTASDTGLTGVTAVIKPYIGIVTLRFVNFSFASGTGSDSNAYQLDYELWPAAALDLVSVHNGVRFKITEEGYVQPNAAVSSSTAIRGSFTYITAVGNVAG